MRAAPAGIALKESHTMPDSASPPLPDRAGWRFDAIACSEPDRARKLESAGTPRALLCEIGDALNYALDSRDVRIGREHAGQRWDDCRIVVQFGVHPDVFDWFFKRQNGVSSTFSRTPHPWIGV